MAVTFNISAKIIDIQSDIPKKGDVFLVDTNALLWMTYSKVSNAQGNSRLGIIQKYQDYLNDAIQNGATLLYSGLSLAELTHQVENYEFSIYNKTVRQSPPPTKKEFRHNPGYANNQKQILLETKSVWQQVSQFGVLLETHIDNRIVQSAGYRMKNCKIDGYDIFILESMMQKGVTKIITDDGDFSTVPGIEVFTANRNVIATASQTSHLITR